MVNKKGKRIALGLVIISLIFFNIFQNMKISKYEENTQQMNTEFKIGLDMVCFGIEDIEKAKVKKSVEDKILGIAILSSGTEKLNTIYMYTDYYKENEFLYLAISNLNMMITNNSKVNDLLDNHNFTSLIPIIKALRENPLDEKATEELYSLNLLN